VYSGCPAPQAAARSHARTANARTVHGGTANARTVHARTTRSRTARCHVASSFSSGVRNRGVTLVAPTQPRSRSASSVIAARA